MDCEKQYKEKQKCRGQFVIQATPGSLCGAPCPWADDGDPSWCTELRQLRQHPDSAWLARLGVRVKGEVGMGAGRLQPYAHFNLYRASNGNDVASFIAQGGRTAIASSTGGTSAELAAGATLALTPTFGLYGEIGKLWSAGGDTRVKSSVQGGIGARILW
ncbi:hypothetical protein DBV14_06385 [Variovorax sp. KBW07]|uniref:autotransporter domain-containing protein n=1 Tax=Variovorax sp. KBW07 TaxID=2153358 RepID=UPI000F5742EA|nr:autotransporter outer membrane beta-barrel domain-containing protein [Variovorax sp. KBW07]RQO60191.1 hypothetical protein DBV14_06385 [Variovorax sp. KBW07]